MKGQPTIRKIVQRLLYTPQTNQPTLYNYLAALASVLLVVVIRLALHQLVGERSPYILFLIVVAFVAWVFGTRPALFALAVSSVLANMLFTQPLYHFAFDSLPDFFSFVSFLIVGFILIAITHAQRQQFTRLQQEIQQRALTEERLQLATSSLQGVVYDWQRSNDETWRSSGLTALIGHAPDDVTTSYHWWQDQMHPDDRLRVLDEVIEISTARQLTQNVEYRVRHKDGHYLWVWDQGNIRYTPDGQLDRISGVTLDITDQKEAETRNEILLNLVSKLSAALSAREIGAIITEIALKIVGADRSGVFRLSEDGRRLQRLVVVGLEHEVLQAYPDIPIDGAYPIAEAVREQKMVSIGSQAEYMARYPHLSEDIRRTGVKATLCFPFFIDNQPTGGMYVSYTYERTFDENERALLFLTAHFCGQALERVSLYEAEARKTARLESLQGITAQLSSAATPQEVIQVMVNRAFPILGAHIGAVALLNKTHDGVDVIAHLGVQQKILNAYQHIPFTNPTPIGDAARTNQAVWIDSLESYDRLYPQIPKTMHIQSGTQAVACLPLQADDIVLGSMGMSFPTPQRFDAEDRAFITTLAQQSAQALLRAQLSEQAQELAVLQERQRIARELHDGATQSIFAANILVESLPQIWQRNPQRALAQIEQVHQLTQSANSELRMLLYEFHPENITRAKLTDLYGHLARVMETRNQMKVEIHVSGRLDTPLPEPVHFAFYRIGQESLNNILKHGQAQQVRLHLRYGSQQASLTIVDNGRGFDTRKASDGFGLNSMRARAQAINARLSIRSRPGTGTRIRLVWDYPHTSAAEV